MIVVFANRLPVRRGAHGWREAPGGLVAALRPALEGRDGTWVGWDPAGGVVPERIDSLDIALRPVTLTRGVADGSYHGFANRTLWPLLHALVEQPVFDARWWHAYQQANRAFAAADPGIAGVRWVHDYQLMLVPQLLRERDAPGPIGFFLHVPFPPPEIFARLPWREPVLRGLLGADLVSFHTARYRDSFLRTCAELLHDVEIEDERIVLADGRRVRVAANPISIAASAVADRADSDPVAGSARRLRRELRGKRLLLGVDRMDYTKGIVQRLEAIELLLEKDEQLRSQFRFVQIAVPSRGEISEYQDLREHVERLVGRINGRFTGSDHSVPVHYLFRGVSFDRLLAYYRVADVCVVTPLADGMNLVAKEFVAVQGATKGEGVLVLSEFAGAIEELPEALPCNPFDVEGLAGSLGLALQLPSDDRAWRIARMADRIATHDVARWAEQELTTLEASGGLASVGGGSRRGRARAAERHGRGRRARRGRLGALGGLRGGPALRRPPRHGRDDRRVSDCAGPMPRAASGRRRSWRRCRTSGSAGRAKSSSGSWRSARLGPGRCAVSLTLTAADGAEPAHHAVLAPVPADLDRFRVFVEAWVDPGEGWSRVGLEP